MKEYWDKRYGHENFTYGVEPNIYVGTKLPLLAPGKILFPADGEGRNSVYAAKLGWDVSAFDYSNVGKEKAENLAKKNNVKINFTVQRFLEENYEQNEFDVIGLTFVHFEPELKIEMHQRLDSYLKVGGYIILEAFSKEHREINKVNPAVGGPPDENMMYSIIEIERDFLNYEFLELKKEMINLNEGVGHIGQSSVIRFVGKKKNSII